MLWLTLLAVVSAIPLNHGTSPLNRTNQTQFLCPQDYSQPICRRGTYLPRIIGSPTANTTNASLCTACPAGHCCSRSMSFACPSGHFQPLAGQDFCLRCTTYAWTNGQIGQSVCVCQSGAFGVVDNCYICPIGSFCVNSMRTDCPLDTFAMYPGSSSCEPCGPFGSTQGQTNQARCSCLQGGFFNSTHCEQCWDGFSCDGNGPPACPSGFYLHSDSGPSCARQQYTDLHQWNNRVEGERRFWGSLHPAFGR